MKVLFIICFTTITLLSMAQPVSRGLNPTNNTDINGADVIGTNYAVVVGISKYAQIQNLLYADDDAALFSEYLSSQGICQPNNMSVLIDSTATTANFYKELNLIRNRILPKDRVIIYFAGHGDVETDLESGFLLSFNTEKSNYAATSIDINMLQRYVDAFIKKGVSVILITDACRSGNLAGGLAGTTSTLNSLKQGFNNCTKILSCQPNQLSLEKRYSDGGHGIFTYHLVNALYGLADRNNDRAINLRELDVYLDSVASETNQRQIPRVEGNPQFIVSIYKDSMRYVVEAKTKEISKHLTPSRGGIGITHEKNPTYTFFQECLKKGQLISPTENNAHYAIKQAELKKEDPQLIKEMKIELSAILEDEVQGFTNKILRGEFIHRSNRKPLAKKYLDYITVAALLQDSTDLRYHEIAAIKTWLESRYQYFSNIFSANTSLIEQLKNADEKINNHALIYNELGTLYFDINKLDSSSYYYKRAIEYCPTWMYPIGNLGFNYEKQGNDSLALYYYRMANQMAPNHSFPIISIGQLYAKYRDFTKAKTYLNQALIIDPTDFHTLQRLGSIAFEENEFQLSKDYYEKAIRLDSTQAESWSGLATADSKLMNDADAEREFLNAIKYAQLHYGLKTDEIILFYDNFASHLINFKKYKVADSIISIILKQDSSNFIAWNKRAQVMFYINKVQEAELSLIRALQINPTAGITNYNLACIYSITNRLTESLSYLERAIKFGYKEYELFESDPDLENLRKTEGYKKLLQQYK